MLALGVWTLSEAYVSSAERRDVSCYNEATRQSEISEKHRASGPGNRLCHAFFVATRCGLCA